MALLALLVLTMQGTGGAWTAEFNGYPDEAAHFVTGKMIREYVGVLSWSTWTESPIEWAGQYYLHYPKVGLGHWPPGYYLLEALWSVPFGYSRGSMMGLQWLMGWASLLVFYLLARPLFPLAVTAGLVLLLAATPVYQQGLGMTMTDLSCLLCSLLFLRVVVGFMEAPGAKTLYPVALVLLVAAMMKGTAVCLAPVPIVAVLASGQRFRIRLRWPVVAAGAALVLCVVWYVSTTDIRYWGGIGANMPWPGAIPGKLAGWGFVGLSAVGFVSRLRRLEPLVLVAGATIGSTLVTSVALRAMNEPRHWIIVLPPVLLLAGYALSSFGKLAGVMLVIPAVLMFPWRWYQQTPGGYNGLLEQLHLPARMMISSGRAGEGAWVAVTAAVEHYPASVVVRASKALARSGWNGEDYVLQVDGVAGAARRLDELGIDVVVLDAPLAPKPPHHVLLKQTVSESSAWKGCGSFGKLVAYCRAEPARVPRVPLVVEAGGRRFEEY